MLRLSVPHAGPIVHGLFGRADGYLQDADGADPVVDEVVQGGVAAGVGGAPAVGFVVGVEAVDGSFCDKTWLLVGGLIVEGGGGGGRNFEDIPGDEIVPDDSSPGFPVQFVQTGQYGEGVGVTRDRGAVSAAVAVQAVACSRRGG